jgi:hypothetical protein
MMLVYFPEPADRIKSFAGNVKKCEKGNTGATKQKGFRHIYKSSRF